MSVTVVVVTRNRRRTVQTTLEHLVGLPGPPPIIMVDNASSDGTAAEVRASYPQVEVILLRSNTGTAARNVGVRCAQTPLVAFCDDDSWWAPDALARATGHFGAHPSLGLLAARVLVGGSERLDPTCARMRRGLRRPGAPGPSILGFLACGAIVRRAAFLGVGGFDARFGIGGEEALLAMDLAAAGWSLAYTDDVVAHHHPADGSRPGRDRTMVRNDLWTSWLRRPWPVAARTTLAALHPRRIGGLIDAAAGARWVRRERRPLPPSVERDLRSLGA
jgi:GT2 family glycosyltransferase